MDKIKCMVNGLPGNVARMLVPYLKNESGFKLLPFSLTGPEIEESEITIEADKFELIHEGERNRIIETIIKTEGLFISIDFTHPSAVNGNATFYCDHKLPFVMGTTGGNRDLLFQTIAASNTVAVVAPNMAKQVVGLQSMVEHAAENYPNLFSGYQLSVRESHQAGKADTSGTALAMISLFNQLGVNFNAANIRMERDPENQKKEWGIPEEYLKGHGWHTYTLTSKDGTVKFEFTHNINGRIIYANGTADAIRFLQSKIDKGVTGKIFSMVDVLKGS